MKTINSTTTICKIPVTTDLNVKPLLHQGKEVINGHGKLIMDDNWVYVNDGRGNYSINVNRAKYCEKIYLSNITIHESIGQNKLMDADLKKFVEQVSDKIVFEKYGRWYRVYLRRMTKRKFTIHKVVPYRFVHEPNLNVHGLLAHNLCIDWMALFYVR